MLSGAKHPSYLGAGFARFTLTLPIPIEGGGKFPLPWWEIEQSEMHSRVRGMQTSLLLFY